MKTYLLSAVLVFVLFPQAVFAEEHEEMGSEEEMELRRMEMGLREREMEMEDREMEMDFRRRMQEMELKKHSLGMEEWHEKKKHNDKGGAAILLFCIVVNILLTVWVYQDIRKKTDSSGIWIVVVLLTGLLGALVYAVVRIGDLRTAKA